MSDENVKTRVTNMLRRTPAPQPTPLTKEQEGKAFRDFFTLAGEKLSTQDGVIANLEQQNGELGNQLILMEKEHSYQRAAAERINADLRKQLAEARADCKQQVAVLTRKLQASNRACAEYEVHISVIETSCAAVMEAGRMAKRSSREKLREVGIEQIGAEVELSDEQMATLHAEMATLHDEVSKPIDATAIGQKFGANNREKLPAASAP